MILIVDDTHEIVEWLVESIREAGYYADFAMDGMSALYKMERIRYALSLIDIGLPRMSGIDLARRVKVLPPPFCNVPMVAMDGGGRVLEDGLFAAVLRKPFLPRDLHLMITAHAAPPLPELHVQRVQGIPTAAPPTPLADGTP